jgi:SAM-dependent methyltransferase
MSSASDKDKIVAHYTRLPETGRLTTGVGLLEAARTRAILERYLGGQSLEILDVGGGTGAYSGWLKSQGHRVRLLDPVPAQVDVAARLGLESTHVGDARALPWPDRCADATLLLGPLYHLPEHADRLQALFEARRTLRPGGRLFAAGISRFGSLLDGLSRNLIADPAFRPILDRDLADGQHRNETGNPEYFTTAYLHYPDELRQELVEAGFEAVEVLAVEGPAWLSGQFDKLWENHAAQDRLLSLIARIEREPSLMGASAHLLAVGVRPMSI